MANKVAGKDKVFIKNPDMKFEQEFFFNMSSLKIFFYLWMINELYWLIEFSDAKNMNIVCFGSRKFNREYEDVVKFFTAEASNIY